MARRPQKKITKPAAHSSARGSARPHSRGNAKPGSKPSQPSKPGAPAKPAPKRTRAPKPEKVIQSRPDEPSYITSAPAAHQLPPLPGGGPEVAFVGRSNCGKSSLLNALLGRKGLARTSRTPGRTQMAHFFNSGKRSVYVDLPGYGFSVAPVGVKKHWESLAEGCLNRPTLRLCLFLKDVRRGWDDEDLTFLRYVLQRRPCVVVLTKADKLTPNQMRLQREAVNDFVLDSKLAVTDIVATSTLKGTGISEVRRLVERWLG